jgi:hypothetical protein
MDRSKILGVEHRNAQVHQQSNRHHQPEPEHHTFPLRDKRSQNLDKPQAARNRALISATMTRSSMQRTPCVNAAHDTAPRVESAQIFTARL